MTPPSERAEPIRDENLARLYQFETAIKSVDGPVVRGLLARITTQAETIRRLEGEVALQARFAEQHAERSFELEQRAEAAEGRLRDEYDWQATEDCSCHCCLQRIARAKAKLSPTTGEGA